MKTPIKISIATFILCTALFFSCKKDNVSVNSQPTQQKAYIYLTDDPGVFDKVLVDIKSVMVMVDTCQFNNPDSSWHDNNGWHGNNNHNNGNGHNKHHNDGNDDNDHHTNAGCEYWKTLDIKPGIYDLLTLRNGTDTLLAGGVLPFGRIEKIKIELGTNNTVVKDSVSYPLHLTNSQSTITINVKGEDWDEFQPGQVRLWLDFDIPRSIVQVRNNEFYLNPWISFFTVKTTGSLSGVVTPSDAYSVISVYNSTDTAYAIPDKHGKFKVRGLDAGTYSVFVNASNGYADTTITGVNVMAGQDYKIANINLHE